MSDVPAFVLTVCVVAIGIAGIVTDLALARRISLLESIVYSRRDKGRRAMSEPPA